MHTIGYFVNSDALVDFNIKKFAFNINNIEY